MRPARQSSSTWRAFEGWADIAERWCAAQNAGPTSFFQSAGWIRTWLSMVAERTPIYVLEVSEGGGTSALGLFADAREPNALRLPQRVAHLHRSGQAAADCITIEYNGLIGPTESRDEAWATLVRDFAAGRGSKAWHCLDLPGLSSDAAERVASLARAAGLRVVVQDRKNVYGVRLDRIPQGSGYLETLGKNTRHQIRRSRREFEKLGTLQLDEARTREEALAFFGRLEILHQDHWRGRGQPGAFAEPFFGEFHRTLIADRFAQGEISLQRMTAGEVELGYLYNFKYGDTVYNYQSGFAAPGDPKIKPGFVAHCLAAEAARPQGFALYDFMAGEAGHKSRLGELTGEMQWLRLQRRGAAQEAEYWARRLKRGIVGLRSRGSVG